MQMQMQQSEVSRIAALEERLAHRKYDVYAPVFNLLNDISLGVVGDAKLPQAERERHQEGSTDFGTWLAVSEPYVYRASGRHQRGVRLSRCPLRLSQVTGQLPTWSRGLGDRVLVTAPCPP